MILANFDSVAANSYIYTDFPLHNKSSAVVDFAIEVEEVYCKCLQHKFQVAQLLQVAALKGRGL